MGVGSSYRPPETRLAPHANSLVMMLRSIKRVINDATMITQLETMFRDKTLTWYMKYKNNTPQR
jgi:hypothetical protein